jgi:ribosome biogenesis GTPase / thiamine phosphate phosphatase
MSNDYKRQNTLKNIIENHQRHEQGVKRQERHKKLRVITKNLKRNQQPKPSRKKDWLEYQGEDWDEVELEQHERVMPRGETERRRKLEKAVVLKAEGKEAPPQTPQPVIEGEQGMVIEASKGLYRVALKDQIVQCPVRGNLKAIETGYTNPVAVGDQVIVRHEGTSGSVIEAVLPRRSVLARPDVFHKHLQQLIVANVDQWLIVLSWREPLLWLELLDRYLVTAERSQLPVVICLNKVDLVEDREECQAVLQPYEDLGYQLLLTSARTGEGLEALQEILQGQLTVVTGMSGVGKSSLLSAARPGLDLRVGQVSDRSGEGRHTTTQATLIRLDEETAVVDTPGIREFGLSGLPQAELVEFFPEIAALAGACRFKDCRHLDEPDCAVRTEVQAGTVAASRYHSYRKIYETLPG